MIVTESSFIYSSSLSFSFYPRSSSLLRHSPSSPFLLPSVSLPPIFIISCLMCFHVFSSEFPLSHFHAILCHTLCWCIAIGPGVARVDTMAVGASFLLVVLCDYSILIIQSTGPAVLHPCAQFEPQVTPQPPMQRTKDRLFALRHHVLLPASALPSADLSLSRDSMSVTQ